MKKTRLLTAIMGLSLIFAVPAITFIHQQTNITIASESPALMRYKKSAIKQINEVDFSLYREEEVLEIASLIEETTTSINEATSINEIDSIVSSFNRYLLTIKTDEQLTKEEQENQQEQQTTYYISSLDDLLEFRDDVNDGYSYANETVILTNDIVIPSDFGTPIGKNEANCFSGTFDGNNHTIKGLKMSAETCAFIYYGTNCTIKNLSFENVNIKATTQRAATVVSRAVNVTLDNVHVLSGIITGPRESGGLIGTAVLKTDGDTTTVRNCSNNASVEATQTASYAASGGIVGFVHSGALVIESCSNTGNITGKHQGTGGILGYTSTARKEIYIDECSNSGTISGANNGTGGIFGASGEAKTVLFTLSNSENHGLVRGESHVGGVAGLPRSCAENSQIIDCKNYGNVEGTGTYTGGIVSRARIAINHCGCLSSATLSCKAASLTAGECLTTGLGASNKPGFICAAVDVNENNGYRGSVSNGYLFL